MSSNFPWHNEAMADALRGPKGPEVVPVYLTPDHLDGGYTATIPSLPGCVSDGETIPIALRRLAEAAEMYLAVVSD